MSRYLQNILLFLHLLIWSALGSGIASAADINISTATTTAQTFNTNGQKLTIANGGDLNVAGVAVTGTVNTGLLIEVNSGNAVNGIKSTGSNSAISISGTATLSSVDLITGIITSAKSAGGTISIAGTGAGSTTNISTDAGTTISNTATSGFAIDATSTTNRTVIIDNAGTISASNNAASNAINFSDSNGGSSYTISNTGLIDAGSLGKAINVGTASAANTIVIDNLGSGSINGAIALSNSDSTTLTNNSSGTITGNISATNANLDVINSTGSIIGNIVLGSNVGSSLAINGGSITGNVTMNNAAQTTTLGGGSLSGTIDGAGQLLVNAAAVLNGNIGATTSLTSATISTGNSLNAATNNNTIRATTVLLANNSSLTLGLGAVTGTIQGVTDGVGTVNFNDNNTLAGAVGTAANSLASIVIANNKTVTAATFNIDSTNILIGNGATLSKTTGTLTGAIAIGSGGVLTTTTGAITGAINGNNAGEGTVNFNNSFTLASGTSIGQTNQLNTVNIANGATLTANDSISAANVNVGTGTSGILTMNAANKSLTGTVNLANGATLNISATGVAVNGDIKGATDDDGIVNINQNFTSNGDLGTSTNSLTSLIIATGKTLDTATNNNDIDATTITLSGAASTLTLGGGTTTGNIALNNASAVVNIGSGAITGNINGSAAARGILNFSDNFTLGGNIGNIFSVASINVAANKTLNAQTNNNTIAATTVSLGNNAALTLGVGAVTGAIQGATDGVGTVNFNDNNTLAGVVGTAANSLASVIIADGKTVTATTRNIDATNIIIGNGSTLSKTTGTLTGAITIGSGGVLTTTTGAITGAINGNNAGEGTINFNNSLTLASGTSIGQSKQLNTINIANGATLTANDSISASNINVGTGTSGILTMNAANKTLTGTVNLANGAILNISATGVAVNGDIKGATDDDGIVNINQNFTANGNLGTATNSLTTITVAAGMTLDTATNNDDIDATTIALAGSGSTLTLGSGTTTGNITFATGSIANIGSGGVSGNMNGTNTSRGTANFSQNFSLSGNIGNTNSLLAVNILAGKTLNAATNNNIIAATTVSLANNSTLILGTGAVTGTTQGSSDGVGTVQFNDNNSLAGIMGTAANSLASFIIADGKTVTATTRNIDATNIIIGAGSTLSKTTGTLTGAITIGSGGVLTTTTGAINGAINGNNAGDGTINFNGSSTVGSGIGQTNYLNNVNIANGATLTVNESIAANNINIGAGISGVLTVNTANKTLTGNVNLANGAILNISATGTVVNGDITGVTDDDGILNINQNFTSNGDLGTSTNSLTSIVIAAGRTLEVATNNNNIDATTITLAGAASTLNLGNGTTTGNISLNNATAALNVASGTITGNINANVANRGIINFTDNFTLNGNIGNTFSVASVNVAANKTVNAAANNNTIAATTLSLGNNSTLILGTGAVTGTIQGATDGVGLVQFNDNNILAGAVGTAANSLDSIIIAAGKTLTAATFNIDATNIVIGNDATLSKTTGTLTGNITLNSGAVLTTTTGAITGAINGDAAGDGTINFNGNTILAVGTSIGQSNKIDAVNIANGAVLTANESIAANNINIGSGTSGVLTVNTANKTLTGNINLADGAILNINAAGTVVNGDIKGATDDDGIVNINQNFTSSANLGTSTNSLTSIIIATGATLDVATNNNNIDATTITLSGVGSKISLGSGTTVGNIIFGSGAVANIGSGAISGTLNGSAANQGTANFAQNYTLGGNIGDNFALATINIANGKTVITGANNITASNINIDSGAVLQLANGIVTGRIRGVSDGVGSINFTDNFTSNGDFGAAANSLSNIIIANGKALTMSAGNIIDSTTIILGSGSVLNANNGAIIGSIEGASDGVGTVNFAANNALTGNIGTPANSLSAISIANGVTLDATAAAIDASNIVIGNGSVLTLGANTVTGAINGAASGLGTVNLNATRTLGANATFGATNNLAAINIADGAAITANQSINATNVNIGGGTSGSLDLAANKAINGNVNIGNGAVLKLNNNSSVSGAINGSAAGVGNLEIANGATYTSNSAIGSSNALANMTININAIFNLGNNLAVNNITNSGVMSFGNISRSVTGSVAGTGGASFDFAGALHSISNSFTTVSGDKLKLEITSPTSSGKIAVGGIATIASGTNLDINFNTLSYIPNNTIYNIISGAAGSAINAISDSDIDVNSSGSNDSGTLIFTTEQSGDNLILAINRNPNPSFVSGDADNKNLYAVINEIGAAATGELRDLQNYLDSASVSDAEKTATLKSITAQFDNSPTINAIETTKLSLNVISNRLQNLRSGVASGDEMATHGLWGKFFDGSSDQGTANGSGAFNSKIQGFAFGSDKEISENTDVGLSVSYAKSNIDSQSIIKNTDINSYQISGYSAWNKDKFFINSLLGFSFNKYNSSRNIAGLGLVANSDYDGQTYMAQLEGGVNYDLENGFTLVPSIITSFMHNEVSGYTEEGARTLNLATDSYATNFFEGRIGGILNYNIITENGWRLNPQVKASIGYDFVGDKQSVTSNFVGYSVPFKSQSQDPQRTSIILGTSINIYSSKSISFSADYNYEYKKKYKANSIAIDLRYDF